MSEHDKERLDLLELRLADLLIRLDHSEVRLQQVADHVARQNDALNRVLNLLGLSLADLEAEATLAPKPHSLLLLMRQAVN